MLRPAVTRRGVRSARLAALEDSDPCRVNMLRVKACRRASVWRRRSVASTCRSDVDQPRTVPTREVVLLDHVNLLRKLRQLERRTSRQGRDIVDHPPRLQDDHANARALALLAADEAAPWRAYSFRDAVVRG